jgi:hypothetical protein
MSTAAAVARAGDCIIGLHEPPVEGQMLKRSLARITPVLVGALCLLPQPCLAQTIRPGTFEVSGVTGLMANRQTISSPETAGQISLSDLDVTSLIFGAEVTYFITEHVGFGGLVNHQRLSLTAPSEPPLADLASTYFGPFVSVRLPLGGRSTFVLAASVGGTAITIVNQNTGVGSGTNVTADGKYWLAGGGLSLGLTPRTSFDLGVRYQDSTYNGQPGTGPTTTAGLLVSVAFSLYLGR